MSRILLKFGLWGLGLSAIFIGASLSLFGPDAVARIFNRTFHLIYIDGPITDLATRNIESELRFFGMMFLFYGVSLLWLLRDYRRRFHMIPPFLAVFFLAGLGRLIGFIAAGPPHLLFKSLMYIELGLPLILFLFWGLDRKRIARDG